MNKVINKFKEDVENVEIPLDELDAVIKKEIIGHSRNNRSRKKVLFAIATAILFFILLLGSSYVSPTMANVLSKIPFISSVLPSTDVGLQAANEKGLVKSIGQTVNQEGIMITITDVYYDHSRLEIGYSIPFEEEGLETLKKYKILGVAKANIEVDSQDVGYSGHSTLRNDYIIGTITIDNHDLPKFKDKVNITLDITEVLNKKGHWEFHLSAKKAEEDIIIHPDQDVREGDYVFSINTIELTPGSTKMEYSFSIPSSEEEFNEQALDFSLITDTGKTVATIKKDMIFIENSDDRRQYNSQILFEPIEDVESLTVTPIIKDSDGKGDFLDGLEFEIPIP
ncbi:DUF4179 domain-containing protein [Rossellomorea aquimaris]|uniref:DUF4179 domain-containing protein n=1 Tax=Rossellomorea aquimaris TaxID=189382 RepID=UPI001CD3614C|nr:DUF4179 domain-containing protein [Rossellomorea aquimaris]MCA1057737.1 DUF4179 domain-containing protein [Rossellomorea aquimaris]